MGGSSATQAAPIAGYNQNMFSGLNLGSGVTNAAIASAPELRIADISGLQKMANSNAWINAIKSQQMEQQLTPDVANTRANLSSQVSQDLAQFNGDSTAKVFSSPAAIALGNLWKKSGMTDAIATGADVNGTFARSALADTTRADYYSTRDAEQAKAANLLSANPQPVAGLDVGSLASVKTNTDAANANAMDAYKSQVLGFLGNQSSNVMNAFQQAMQMEAARRSGNAQAQNAAAGSSMGLLGSLGGAGIGAAAGIGGGILVAF
jgi:hypothetical protein